MRLSLPPRARLRSFSRIASAVVASGALVFAGAAGAQAAPVPTVKVPSAKASTAKASTAQVAVHRAAPRPAPLPAPTHVMVTGVATSATATTAELAWDAVPATSKRLAGYVATIAPAKHPARSTAVVTRATVRTATFRHLTVGASYALSVRAFERDHGRVVLGKAATVSFTATAPVAKRVFALDASGSLVRFEAAGGASTTLATGVIDYTVDSDGDAFALTIGAGSATGTGTAAASTGTTSVVEVTAVGATRTVLADAAGATSIEVDAKGDVFLQAGAVISKVAAGSTTAGLVSTEPVTPVAFGVRPDGTVSLLENVEGTHVRVTIPANAPATSTPTRTQLVDSPYYSPISGEFDSKGDLYYRSIATGASGSIQVQRLGADEVTPTGLGGGYVRGGVGADDSFALLQSTTWCTSYGLGTGSCVPDLSVRAISVTTAAGGTTSVPVDGLSLSSADTAPSGVGTSVTTDSAGRIYVAGRAGIVAYAATGGAPTALAAGAFTDVQVAR